VILIKNTVQNDWMHLNVRWGTKWLEWIIVTPRYHHIHHSDRPEHYRGNVAALFPIWDRMFGTYVDPESAPRNLSFGIGEKVPALRLFAGI
jgi:sterol desaturase/sphingolipid hydroxylase (fatty acid hydroxylase superfamily)